MKNVLGGKQLPQKIFSMIQKIQFYFIKRIINEGVWPARELTGHNLIFTQFLWKHLHAFHVTRFRKRLGFGQPRRGDAGWHLAVTSACVQSSCLSSGITDCLAISDLRTMEGHDTRVTNICLISTRAKKFIREGYFPSLPETSRWCPSGLP